MTNKHLRVRVPFCGPGPKTEVQSDGPKSDERTVDLFPKVDGCHPVSVSRNCERFRSVLTSLHLHVQTTYGKTKMRSGSEQES